MKLQLTDFTKRFGQTTVIENLDLTVQAGEMIALLGPSGCGKSTTLFAICGIHNLDGGSLYFGDRDVTHTTAQERNVGVVFQNYALYPHMSVFDNIAFPLRVQRRDNSVIAEKVRSIAAFVHIPELLERRPAELSGGQQQRVALARALVREPDILLLDEPLANLDAKLRLEMRAEIRRVQLETGITAILVTHDQVEAMSMCDRIALMNKGRIVQYAVPEEMYRNPTDMFVADFLGNPPIAFVGATAHGDGLVLDGGQRIGSDRRFTYQGQITLGVRPEHFGPQYGAGLRGEIRFMETHGREDLFSIALAGGGELRSIQPAGSGLRLGDRIDWAVSGPDLLAFAEDGAKL